MAALKVIRDMTTGGKLALVLSCLWVFGLAACSSGGGCIPGCGARLPTPAPPRPEPATRVVKVTLQERGIAMPHVLPPGPTLLKITNDDYLAHYLEIERLDTQNLFGVDIMPGTTKELKIYLEPGRYRLWCPFHRKEAQQLELVVTVTPSHAPAYPY